MIRLWQALWLFIGACLSVHAQIDLDNPEVRKKIIAQAAEVTVEKKPDGSFVFYDPITGLRHQGTGWTVFYYDNGSLESLFQLKDGQYNGLFKGWYDNGEKKVKSNWKDGKPDGLRTEWYENGEKKAEANFKDGKQCSHAPCK